MGVQLEINWPKSKKDKESFVDLDQLKINWPGNKKDNESSMDLNVLEGKFISSFPDKYIGRAVLNTLKKNNFDLNWKYDQGLATFARNALDQSNGFTDHQVELSKEIAPFYNRVCKIVPMSQVNSAA